MVDYFDKAMQYGQNSLNTIGIDTAPVDYNSFIKKEEENYEKDRLAKLSKAKDAKLLGLQDADTFLVEMDGRRVSIRDALQSMKFDALETHNLDEISKSKNSLKTQREFAANFLKKPINEVTTQDIYDIGNMQQVQRQATLIDPNTTWQAPYIKNAVPLNLSQGLNIPIKVNISGKDKNNRYLGEMLTPTGVNLTEKASYNPLINPYANKITDDFISKYTPEGIAAKNKENYDAMAKGFAEGKHTVVGSLARSPQAFLSGLGKSVYDFADTTVEFVGNASARVAKGLGASDKVVKALDSLDLGTEEQKTKFFNNAVGYNDANVAKTMESLKTHWENAVKDVELFKPSTWAKLDTQEAFNAFKDGLSSPEMTAASTGYLIPYLYGAVEKGAIKLMSAEGAAATKAMVKVASNPTIEASAKLAELNKLKNGMSVGDKTKLFLANHSDALAMGANLTNDQLDEVIAKNGGNMDTLFNVGLKFALNSAGAKLDMKAATSIMKGESPVEGLSNYLGSLGKNRASKAMAQAAKYGTTLVGAGLEELGQEFTQSWIEAFSRRYGTKDEQGKEVSAYDAAFSPQALSDAAQGAIAGAAGGVHMAMPHATASLVKNTLFTGNSREDNLRHIAETIANTPDSGMQREILNNSVNKYKDEINNIVEKQKDVEGFQSVSDLVNETLGKNYFNDDNVKKETLNKLTSIFKDKGFIKSEKDIDSLNPASLLQMVGQLDEEAFKELKATINNTLNTNLSNYKTAVDDINNVLTQIDEKTNNNKTNEADTSTSSIHLFDDIINNTNKKVSENATDTTTAVPTLDEYKSNLMSSLSAFANNDLKYKIQNSQSIEDLYNLKDEINDELYSKEQISTFTDIADNTKPFTQQSIPARIARSVLGLAGISIGVNSVKDKLENKLTTISTNVLTKLASPEALETLSKSFKTESGTNPISVPYLTKIVNKELKNRKIANLFVYGDKTNEIKPKSFNDENSVVFASIAENVKKLKEEQPLLTSKEFYSRLDDIYKEVEHAFSTLSIKQLQKFGSENTIKLLGLDTLGIKNIEGKSPAWSLFATQAQQKSMPDKITINGNQLNNPQRIYTGSVKFNTIFNRSKAKALMNYNILNGTDENAIKLQKAYLARTLQAKFTQSRADIDVAEQILEKFQKNDDLKFDNTTYKSIKHKLNTLKLDSKSLIEEINAEEAKKSNELRQTIEKLVKEVGGNPATINEFSDEQINEVASYFMIDETMLQHLEAFGFDFERDKEYIVQTEQTVEIC